jgi:hypothetical protein
MKWNKSYLFQECCEDEGYWWENHIYAECLWLLRQNCGYAEIIAKWCHVSALVICEIIHFQFEERNGEKLMQVSDISNVHGIHVDMADSYWQCNFLTQS